MSNCLATSLGRPTLCSSLAKLQCQLFARLGTFVLQVFLDLADPISKAFVFRFGRASQLSTGPQGKPFPFSQIVFRINYTAARNNIPCVCGSSSDRLVRNALTNAQKENRTVCWDINTQQSRISLLMNPEENNSCSEMPCELQRLDMKFPSSKSSVSLPAAQEELGKQRAGKLPFRVPIMKGCIKGSTSSSSSPLLCDLIPNRSILCHFVTFPAVIPISSWAALVAQTLFMSCCFLCPAEGISVEPCPERRVTCQEKHNPSLCFSAPCSRCPA